MVVDGGRTIVPPPNYYQTAKASTPKQWEEFWRMETQHGFYTIAMNVSRKGEIDAFFLKSFLEIGFFDRVKHVPQSVFEKIIIPEADKKRTLEKELTQTHSRQISSKLGALKKRHKEGAISDEEYMRKQREIVNEYARARIKDARTRIAISDAVYVVSDLTGLHYVQEHYGDNLVVGIVIKAPQASNHVEMDLKILDPVTGDTVFHAHNGKYVWNNLDQPLFYPLFNAFIDWIEKNSGTIDHSLFWDESGRERPENAVTVRNLRSEFHL